MSDTIGDYQREWLMRHGGRTERDVEHDEHGYFVLMYTPYHNLHPTGFEKVYLPK